MSYDEVAGMALSGEFTAESFLKLLSYEPPRYKIPAKYTGNRNALRNLKKARKHVK